MLDRQRGDDQRIAMRAPSPLVIVGFAVLCGCCIDAVVKGVAAEVSVVMIMAWRFLFGGAYAGVIYAAKRKPIPRGEAIRFHAFRGAVQLASAIGFFWSLTQLSLAEATVIAFTAALMIAPIARVILGEKLSPLSVGAAMIGFAGAAFTMTGETTGAPPEGDRLLGALVCAASAFGYALVLVLMRLRTRKEDALTIVMFTNVMPALIILPWLIWNLPATPWDHLYVFAGLGVSGLAVWYMMTVGYGRAEAQKLAVLEYTALIWAALLGFLFFKEVPGWRLYAGAGVIILACLAVAFESHFRNRREARMPASDHLE